MLLLIFIVILDSWHGDSQHPTTLSSLTVLASSFTAWSVHKHKFENRVYGEYSFSHDDKILLLLHTPLALKQCHHNVTDTISAELYRLWELSLKFPGGGEETKVETKVEIKRN